MKKKKGFGKKGKQSGDMSLNITAMADIFMILLVFLLKGYAAGAMNLNPSAGLILPEAEGDKKVLEALKVEISETAVSVEGEPVTKLKNFLFEKGELNPNGSSKVLSAALEKERKRQLLIAQSNTQVQVDPKIVVVADQRVPYATIKNVLASAAVNGYTDFKLAVIAGD